MSFDPGMLHNNGHTAFANGSAPGLRETGVVEKLLTSYGFIQCSERQARLFFHCSQYNGNLQELKIGGQQPLLTANVQSPGHKPTREPRGGSTHVKHSFLNVMDQNKDSRLLDTLLYFNSWTKWMKK